MPEGGLPETSCRYPGDTPGAADRQPVGADRLYGRSGRAARPATTEPCPGQGRTSRGGAGRDVHWAGWPVPGSAGPDLVRRPGRTGPVLLGGSAGPSEHVGTPPWAPVALSEGVRTLGARSSSQPARARSDMTRCSCTPARPGCGCGPVLAQNAWAAMLVRELRRSAALGGAGRGRSRREQVARPPSVRDLLRRRLGWPPAKADPCRCLSTAALAAADGDADLLRVGERPGRGGEP